MSHRAVWIKTIVVLAVVWGCVWGIRAYAGSRKVTAERVNKMVYEANFTDWSGGKPAGADKEASRRDAELREIAEMVNRLDFEEREKNRDNRTGEQFFRKLSPDEKGLFINLTIAESMGHFMEALDAMKPEQRRKFVEQGLKEVQEGRTREEMERTDALASDLLDKISQEGMKAYFEKSSADTKLDLAPLMEAMNETMQGMRGNEFGPQRQH